MTPTPEQQRQPYELLIGSTLYDCRNFTHPGGSVLKYYMGSGDATEAFVQMHIKLPKAEKYLKSLPSRPAPPDTVIDPTEQKRLRKLSEEFDAFNKQLVKEGLFEADFLHVAYRFAELIGMYVLGLWMLFHVPFLWPLSLLILGVVEGRCGWWMHEAGHYSVTSHRWLDIKIQEVVYGLGCGMSGAWWRVQHNKHHASPQKDGYDADLATLPLVAFNKVTAKRGKKSAAIRRWISMQGYLFAPVTCSFMALFWQLYLHPRHIIRTRRYTEAVSILARWIILGFVCHALGVSVLRGLGGTLLSQAFGAAYIFVSFALNHSHLPVLPRDKHAHWMEYGSVYTMDVASNPFVNWFMGYLNFQSEHHLFPSMPQFRFVKLAPRVKELLERNGLPYDSRPYFDVLRTTFKNLNDVGAYMYVKDD